MEKTNQRVWITGRSALTASGATDEETWASILAGESGLSDIQQWDLSSWTHRLGGELKSFQPGALLPDRKLLKVISRQDVMGIHAATQAVSHSQLIPYRDTLDSPTEFNEKTAVFVGSPGNKYAQQYDFLPLLAKTGGELVAFAESLFSEVHPMWLLRILPNNVLAYTGITYGFKGINQNITNHAVGGTQALIEAYHAIRLGAADRAVVVAYDVGLEPQALYYYAKLGVLSERHLKPFDKSHDGTLLGEGAAALVLESEASVQRRGARCYGELLGGGSASEAKGLFSLDASGHALAGLINRVLKTTDLNAADLGVVVAHGNGNPSSDQSEALALGRVLGGESVPVTAFKWAMGHTLSASGVVDAVLASHALEKKCIPGVATLDELASDCAHLHVTDKTQSLDRPPVALLISRGYGSMNACVVIKG